MDRAGVGIVFGVAVALAGATAALVTLCPEVWVLLGAACGRGRVACLRRAARKDDDARPTDRMSTHIAKLLEENGISRAADLAGLASPAG
jgi:hypothetical protein